MGRNSWQQAWPPSALAGFPLHVHNDVCAVATNRALHVERAARAEELAAARKSLAELQESIAARVRTAAHKVGERLRGKDLWGLVLSRAGHSLAHEVSLAMAAMLL
jgi:glucose-6-phosphate-specific signal transduction histidine kinase